MSDRRVSRRTLLAGSATAAGLVATGHLVTQQRTAFAATLGSWNANDLSIETGDGRITDIYLADGDATFTLDWTNFDADQSVTFTLEARLAGATDGAGTYETLTTGEFTATAPDGSLTHSEIAWTTPPFPASFITDHSSITTDHFENPDDGTTATIQTIEVRLTWDYGYGTEVHEVSFTVDVENLAAQFTSSGSFEPKGDAESGGTTALDFTGYTLTDPNTEVAIDDATTYTGTLQSGSNSRARLYKDGFTQDSVTYAFEITVTKFGRYANVVISGFSPDADATQSTVTEYLGVGVGTNASTSPSFWLTPNGADRFNITSGLTVGETYTIEVAVDFANQTLTGTVYDATGTELGTRTESYTSTGHTVHYPLMGWDGSFSTPGAIHYSVENARFVN